MSYDPQGVDKVNEAERHKRWCAANPEKVAHYAKLKEARRKLTARGIPRKKATGFEWLKEELIAEGEVA